MLGTGYFLKIAKIKINSQQEKTIMIRCYIRSLSLIWTKKSKLNFNAT